MKSSFDVFNGDADGICALHQLRLTSPKDNVLISGVKRDISLLKQVDPTTAKEVTVLDIALGKNRTALNNLLSRGVNVFYADHHDPGEIPIHATLTTHIHNNANTCTSLIINNLIKGQYHQWALVGAYGDNLLAVADNLAKKKSLNKQQRTQLMRFGTYLNYNGYGQRVTDLLFSPVEMYTLISPYSSPFTFLSDRHDIYAKLEHGFLDDNEKTAIISPCSQEKGSRVFILPNAPWARRISGIYSNQLSNQDPTLANAVITATADDNYVVSIRSPLNNRTGADELAALFSTGGGRKAAAGINALPATSLAHFIATFHQHYRVIPKLKN